MFLRWAILVAIVIVIAAMITQVIFPILRGGLLFPLFRKRYRLKKAIAVAHEDISDARLEQEREDLRKALADIQAKTKSKTKPKRKVK